ncbi:hypothetical protein HPP92_017195 [Vanilla planifolia]|uniref:Uncharacterized protein n=1 Tax=Vanilla planifolia TaxID=51239 RepID=A0A835QCA3_VANPL|nr:hypothetical protein HPP92_017195 [Vanilla planifolia]
MDQERLLASAEREVAEEERGMFNQELKKGVGRLRSFMIENVQLRICLQERECLVEKLITEKEVLRRSKESELMNLMEDINANAAKFSTLEERFLISRIISIHDYLDELKKVNAELESSPIEKRFLVEKLQRQIDNIRGNNVEEVKHLEAKVKANDEMMLRLEEQDDEEEKCHHIEEIKHKLLNRLDFLNDYAEVIANHGVNGKCYFGVEEDSKKTQIM